MSTVDFAGQCSPLRPVQFYKMLHLYASANSKILLSTFKRWGANFRYFADGGVNIKKILIWGQKLGV